MKETKQLFLKLQTNLIASGAVKTVQMYNNQIPRLVVTVNKAGVIDFPAVLVEFVNINYMQKGSRLQEYTGIVRLHTCVYDLVQPGLIMYDVLHSVHQVASLLTTENTTELIRVRDDTDNDYNNLCVNMTDYQFRATVVAEPTLIAPIDALDIRVE